MIKRLLSKPDEAFASPLILWLVSEHGPDVITYEPETIRECFNAVEKNCSDAVVSRVNAALGLFTNNRFWVDPLSFGITCRLLNRHRFPGSAAPDISDIAWGVTEATLLTADGALSSAPGDNFSDGVHRFVTVTMKDCRLHTTPDYLRGFGPVSDILGISDAAIAVARQQESDAAAALIDSTVSDKIIEMFDQIDKLNIPLIESAAVELRGILNNGRQIK